MRFRTVSKMLVAAVLAGGAGAGSGCGGAQTDTVVTPPPAPPARPESWTRVSILKLLDQHAPVPADARGVYVRTPHCTNCIEIVRGPELYGACTDTPCAVPIRTDPYADRLLYLDAGGHVRVVPWSALAPVIETLIAERGAAARDDADIAVLRTLRDGAKLARVDAWVEITADGAFRIADGFPPELRMPYEQAVASWDPSQPVPPNVPLSLQMVQAMGVPVPVATTDEAAVGGDGSGTGGAVPVVAPDPGKAAIALAWAAHQEQRRDGGFLWVAYRPLARGALVTFGGGGGCMPSATASYVVEDGAASLVDQMELGFPDECRPRGRRPEGLASRPAEHGDALARWYAEAMHMEAASVPAFERLAAELAALGAPPRLVRAARAAARDEVRHAATMSRLGARAGALPADVVVETPRARTLEAIAIENAVEGCVNEGFAAILCEYQARTAADPAVRAAMAVIADEEAAHAGLAFTIAAWLDTQLTAQQRAAVDAAVARARDELPTRAAAEAASYATVATTLGLPTTDDARCLAQGYASAMCLRPEVFRLRPEA